MFFNREKLLSDYKKILRPEEDVCDQGNKGYFMVKEGFNIIILSKMEDPDFDYEIITMVTD